MNFLLSEQQIEIQEAVDRFLSKALPSTTLVEGLADEHGHDAALWGGLAEVGATAVLVPEEHGGLGLELIDAALVAETLGRHATPGPWLGHTLAVLALKLSGSAEQCAQWLPQLADGSKIATVAFRDAGGWQPEQWSLAGGASITGDKLLVPSADVADLFIVGTAGGGLALVPRPEGLQTEAQDGIDRTRRLFSVRFEGAAAEPLAGSPDAAARMRDAGLALLAADAFGGASHCLALAVDYAKTRQQFGVVIGQFQGLKHQLANMAVELEPARGLYWYAAHAFDHVPAESARSAALAKSHLGDRFVQLARDAVEAHGGIGYTWEYPLHAYLKRALFDSAWLGSPREHRVRAAALAGW